GKAGKSKKATKVAPGRQAVSGRVRHWLPGLSAAPRPLLFYPCPLPNRSARPLTVEAPYRSTRALTCWAASSGSAPEGLVGGAFGGTAFGLPLRSLPLAWPAASPALARI